MEHIEEDLAELGNEEPCGEIDGISETEEVDEWMDLAGEDEELVDGEGDSEDEEGLEDDFEEIDLEFDEDDIEAYIVDEDDNEIGFIILDENGEEVEYYYVEEEGEPAPKKKDDEYDFGITREGVAQTTNDINAIYRDGRAVASEFKGAFDDIKSALDFKSMLK